MTFLIKIKYLLALAFVLLAVSACSLGYNNEGPYPYSHVNKKPLKTKGDYLVRNKPTPPKTSELVAKNISKVLVSRGDTVFAISRRYGVTVREVISRNSLKPPYILKSGQSLNIPKGFVYTTKRGDTVYGISRANGILMNDLTSVNGLKQPYLLVAGQLLKIPGGSKGYAPTAVVTPPTRSAGKGFMWPVRGSVISGYGPKKAGYHNDGVNIRARLGATVQASESGVVVHASNKLQGYGNLVLIKHQNGWVTAYAHNDKILVRKGQQVARGQAVAEVGSTGRVDSPQLHFEMRKGSRAVNPTLYLKS